MPALDPTLRTEQRRAKDEAPILTSAPRSVFVRMPIESNWKCTGVSSTRSQGLVVSLSPSTAALV